jgi:hypothetical protein
MAQMKHTVTYRENEKEKELYEWIEEKSVVIGSANAIKQILYEEKIKEKNKNNN